MLVAGRHLRVVTQFGAGVNLFQLLTTQLSETRLPRRRSPRGLVSGGKRAPLQDLPQRSAEGVRPVIPDCCSVAEPPSRLSWEVDSENRLQPRDQNGGVTSLTAIRVRGGEPAGDAECAR
jgi:hypothetical protein